MAWIASNDCRMEYGNIRGLAFPTEPFLLSDCDYFALNGRVMAMLMPCAVASIAEHDSIARWTMTAVANTTPNICAFQFSRDGLARSGRLGSVRGPCKVTALPGKTWGKRWRHI